MVNKLASVDGIYDEYPALLETMNVLEMEGGTGGGGGGGRWQRALLKR